MSSFKFTANNKIKVQKHFFRSSNELYLNPTLPPLIPQLFSRHFHTCNHWLHFGTNLGRRRCRKRFGQIEIIQIVKGFRFRTSVLVPSIVACAMMMGFSAAVHCVAVRHDVALAVVVIEGPNVLNRRSRRQDGESARWSLGNVDVRRRHPLGSDFHGITVDRDI